ncbi:MAG: flagellin [Alphaproteobacteria bacterium]|jgi:flagellin|nr:flagellin [Alphaproteobacteria bacterium]
MASIPSVTTGNIANSYINKNDRAQSKALHALASGKSINKASDNAAGLAIATQLMSDVSTLKQASSNLVQGTAVLQTADGGLQQAGQMLERMKSLATQASSGSVDSTSLAAINTEYQSLVTELDNLSNTTSFNGQNLLNGTYNQSFQAGQAVGDTINANLSAVNSSANGLGLTAGVGASANALSTQTSAMATSAELDTAISNLSSYRAQIGSTLSTFSVRGDVVDSSINSTLEAQSSLMDADIAAEQTNLTNSKVLSELSIASAAQGNRMKSSLLGLLR